MYINATESKEKKYKLNKKCTSLTRKTIKLNLGSRNVEVDGMKRTEKELRVLEEEERGQGEEGRGQRKEEREEGGQGKEERRQGEEESGQGEERKGTGR